MSKIYLHVSTTLAYDAIINKHKKKAFNILLSILFIYLFFFFIFRSLTFFLFFASRRRHYFIIRYLGQYTLCHDKRGMRETCLVFKATKRNSSYQARITYSDLLSLTLLIIQFPEVSFVRVYIKNINHSMNILRVTDVSRVLYAITGYPAPLQTHGKWL